MKRADKLNKSNTNNSITGELPSKVEPCPLRGKILFPSNGNKKIDYVPKGSMQEQRTRYLRMIAMLIFKNLEETPEFDTYLKRLDGLYEYPVECEKWSPRLVRFRVGKLVFDMNWGETYKGRKLDFKRKETKYL